MKKLLAAISLLSVLFFFQPHYAQAAVIAFDTVGNQKTATQTNTLSITPSSSANFLLVFVFINSPQTSTGVTWNGVSMTLITSVAAVSGIGHAYAYYLTNPATGTHNLVSTASAATSGNYTMGLFYSGANTTGQPDAFTTNAPSGSATSLVQTVTTVANNSWAAVISVNDQGSLAAGTNSTLRGTTMDAAVGAFDSNAAITPAGSFSMTQTGGNSNGRVGIIVSFSPAVATVSSFGDLIFFQ